MHLPLSNLASDAVALYGLGKVTSICLLQQGRAGLGLKSHCSPPGWVPGADSRTGLRRRLAQGPTLWAPGSRPGDDMEREALDLITTQAPETVCIRNLA